MGLDHVVEGTEFVVGKITSQPFVAGELGKGFDEKIFTINGKELSRLDLQTNKELEAQKSTALAQLETQVDELSQLIKEKLLGKEVVL